MAGRSQRATLQTIADELGLSKFAVSRALSGKSGVSEDTRKRVVSAAERLGYRARSETSASLVRVIAAHEGVFRRDRWAEALFGMELEAAKDGCQVVFATADSAEGFQELAKTPSGIVLVGAHNLEVYMAAKQSGFPCVVVGPGPIVPPLLEMDQIAATDEESGMKVAEHLVALGHRQLVYVHGRHGCRGRELRLRGFRDSAVAAGADVREVSLTEDYEPVNLIPCVLDILSEDFSPTAFFCGSDGVAVTVMTELRRFGFRIPSDLSIVGAADYPLTTQVTPNLTTIRNPLREIGSEAIRAVRARASTIETGGQRLFTRTQLVSHIVERESSGPAAQPDWSRITESARSTLLTELKHVASSQK